MGIIFDIKELAVHDGQGLRTTIFLKGCPLRCLWCHNPEGLSSIPQLMVRNKSCRHCGLCFRTCSHPECQPFRRCIHICPENLVSIVGEEITASELSKRILKNKDFLLQGGVTFSGGEPLLQYEFMLETIDLLEGIDIAIETSGYADEDVFRKVIEKVDHVYMDIKLADNDKHLLYTGVSNERILNNLKILKESHRSCTIRTPLIKGITDTEDNLDKIKELIGDLPHELLPYNKFADLKYKMLNMEYPLNNIDQ